jgi:hypothetical protein
MTEAREGVSRRGFVKALAAGASAGAVNIATPAAAQQSALMATFSVGPRREELPGFCLPIKSRTMARPAVISQSRQVRSNSTHLPFGQPSIRGLHSWHRCDPHNGGLEWDCH